MATAEGRVRTAISHVLVPLVACDWLLLRFIPLIAVTLAAISEILRVLLLLRLLLATVLLVPVVRTQIGIHAS